MALVTGESITRQMDKSQRAVMTDDEINAKYAKGEIRIVTEQSRYQLPSISGMLKSGDYILNPEFQRRHRWSDKQKSRLIESLIINVPIPPIFLYEVSYSKFEVMDGLQRLSAISGFYDNEFILEGLEEWTELNGYSYSRLPENIRKGVDRRYLSSIVLLQETAKNKEDEDNLKQLVFNRINSGGVDLTPQESRNALMDGKFNKFCIRLSKNENFKYLLGINSDNDEIYRSMQDVEFVLRFFANRQREKFGGSNESYFDLYLKAANNFKDNTIDELEKIFLVTMDLATKVFKEKGVKIYRPRRRGDKESWFWSDKPSDLVYDTFTTVLSGMTDKAEQIIGRKNILLNDLESFYKINEEIFGGRNVNNSDKKLRVDAFTNYIIERMN